MNQSAVVVIVMSLTGGTTIMPSHLYLFNIGSPLVDHSTFHITSHPPWEFESGLEAFCQIDLPVLAAQTSILSFHGVKNNCFSEPTGVLTGHWQTSDSASLSQCDSSVQWD